ncbi:MAG: hypothetical protein KKB30_06855 [Proteobacteria bacterium]|nr:hypothetical protein [Pseudomonadota bacterium]MBU1715436.1 hypothetical protein [Pseudomonadota bacterium]
MSITGIIKNISALIMPREVDRAPSSFSPVKSRQGESPADTFEQGNWWKNRPIKAEGCSCGSCGVCGARAYVKQSTSIRGDSKETGETKDGESGIVEPDQSAGQEKETDQRKGAAGESLSHRDEIVLAQLKSADLNIRAHERAHLAAAGSLAISRASFEYVQGPDGRRYAVAGEVAIDTSKEMAPEATMVKMVKVRSAALAPAMPSLQDRKVATRASLSISEAVREIRLEDIAALSAKTGDDQEEQPAGSESQDI